MLKNHLKRIASPRSWSILRKKHKFVTRPHAGAHSLAYGLSLNTIMKDLLGKASTTKEVKRVLNKQEVLVDARKRYDEKFNVGLMDVIHFPLEKEQYRVVFSQKGKLVAIAIPEKEANVKLCKIVSKKIIPGGKFQLGFSDGRSLILEKNAYTVGDSLLLELPSQKVKEHLPLQSGMTVLIYKGKHAGSVGQLESIDGQVVFIKVGQETIQTKKAYTFVVGEKKPIIKCSP